jgi:hypothetical protein
MPVSWWERAMRLGHEEALAWLFLLAGFVLAVMTVAGVVVAVVSWWRGRPVVDHAFKGCRADAGCPACTAVIGVRADGVEEECGRTKAEHRR